MLSSWRELSTGKSLLGLGPSVINSAKLVIILFGLLLVRIGLLVVMLGLGSSVLVVLLSPLLLLSFLSSRSFSGWVGFREPLFPLEKEEWFISCCLWVSGGGGGC